MDSTRDVDQDDSDGCAHGDVKSSDDDNDDADDDDDCEVEAEDDGSHSDSRKEIEEQEQNINVLFKSKQKPLFSTASASVASDPEEAHQRKFWYRKCSSLIVSAWLSLLSSLVFSPENHCIVSWVELPSKPLSICILIHIP